MSTRTPLIAGNWKMYKTNAEAVETAGRLVELVADTSEVDIMIAPVFTALDPVSRGCQRQPGWSGSPEFVLGKRRRLIPEKFPPTCWFRPDANM